MKCQRQVLGHRLPAHRGDAKRHHVTTKAINEYSSFHSKEAGQRMQDKAGFMKSTILFEKVKTCEWHNTRSDLA